MQEHAEQKKQLRARLRQLRERMDEQMRQQAITRINDRLKRELDCLRLNPDRQVSGSLMIFSYLSYGSEASTAFLLKRHGKRGMSCLRPRCLLIRRVWSCGE